MADSHSGILKKEAEELDIHVLPMPFYLNGELFQEDLNFSRKGFYEKLRDGADVSTSQPSPQEVMEITADWISQIRESFPGMDVMCDDLSLGLSCHIGPDGLGIGCSCMPL